MVIKFTTGFLCFMGKFIVVFTRQNVRYVYNIKQRVNVSGQLQYSNKRQIETGGKERRDSKE